MDEKIGSEGTTSVAREGGYGMYHKHGQRFLIKVLITVVILAIVFWSGVRVGAMVGGARAGFAPMMQQTHTLQGFSGGSRRMMGQTGSWSGSAAQAGGMAKPTNGGTAAPMMPTVKN